MVWRKVQGTIEVHIEATKVLREDADNRGESLRLEAGLFATRPHSLARVRAPESVLEAVDARGRFLELEGQGVHKISRGGGS